MTVQKHRQRLYRHLDAIAFEITIVYQARQAYKFWRLRNTMKIFKSMKWLQTALWCVKIGSITGIGGTSQFAQIFWLPSRGFPGDGVAPPPTPRLQDQ